jgi:hypothetical protein
MGYIEKISEALRGASQKERLEVAAWLVIESLERPQAGMAEGYHRLDVVTRFCGDVMTAARGYLSRYGNDGYPNK